MIRYTRYLGGAGAVLALLAAAGWAAAAQTGGHPATAQSGGHPAPASQTTQPIANPLGFSPSSDQPIRITSTSLEVHDKDHYATFSGNVHVVQGESTLRCKTLVVFYEDSSGAPAAPKGGNTAAAKGGPPTSSNQQIKRLECKGNVVVTQKDPATQKDQTATGDNGVFEMKTNTAVLTGNVVVTQGDNVIRGDKLFIDMTTGVSRVESNKGRVDALFKPNSPPGPPANAPGGGAKETKPSAPLNIN
jgi:lipopolysaccharide export system protein LptA